MVMGRHNGCLNEYRYPVLAVDDSVNKNLNWFIAMNFQTKVQQLLIY